MATYPNEAWPADSSIELLDGTSDQKTGLPYLAKGTSPTSSPSYEVQYNRRQARLNGILAAWRQGMVVDEGGLKIGVYPIEFTQGGSRKYFAGTSGVQLADESAKVVYLDGSCLLQVADDWPADLTAYLPLATVTATGGRLLIEDRRPRAAFHVPSLEAAEVRDRRIVTAHRATVGYSESDTEVFAFDPPEDLVLEEVQVYCTATTAVASVDVKEGGVSVLSAAAAPSAGAIVKPSVSDSSIAAANNVTVHVTTDENGDITDLAVTLLFKAPLTS
jgi:hypothetical protein